MWEYKKDLINNFQKQQEEVDRNGTKVIIKVSAEETRPGYLDPSVLEMIKQYWMGKEELPEQEKEAEPVSPELELQTKRDSMGFPNRNLNTVEIHTEFEKLHFDGNDVGLWRYYTRKSKRKSDKPCLIYFHGGGWIGGSVYTVENPCRLIAELADAVVFNIDYSLAPEKKFPNGFHDCFNAVKYIYDHAEEYGIDRNKIAVGGDSAGGNLAATVAVKDRDLGLHMVALQVLIYPCVTFIDKVVEGYVWDINEFDMSDEQKEMIPHFLTLGRPSENEEIPAIRDLYFSDKADARSPYASPMLVDSRGLPRALCVGAEFDGLRVQTEFYAKKLTQAGVPVKTIRYKGCTHAFFDLLGFAPQAEDLCIEIAEAMKTM